MALSRFVLPFTDVGRGIKPSSGAKLFFYATGTGTSTPASTFSDSAGNTPNTNPVISDANGVFPNIFMSGMFNVVLKDSNDVQVWSADPVNGIPSTGTGFDQVPLNSDINTKFVVNFNTLLDAVGSTLLVDGQSVNLKERTTGNFGGAIWDVVLASTVTPNIYSIVESTGIPALALVLRLGNEIDLIALGASPNATGSHNSAVFQYASSQTDFNVINVCEGSFTISETWVLNDKSLVGAGWRKTQFLPANNTIDAIEFAEGSDFFECRGFTVIYPSLGTGNGVTINNDCHNYVVNQVETILASTGMLIGSRGFAVSIDDVRFNNGVNGLVINGSGQATTFKIGTAYCNVMSNIGFNFNAVNDVYADNLIADLISNYPVFVSSTVTLQINNLHMENGDFGSNAEVAYLRLNSVKNAIINNINADLMTSTVPHYAISVQDGPTKLWLKGYRNVTSTNDNLAIINEVGGKPDSTYTFEGTSVDSNSIITTAGGSDGRYIFPDFQNFYFTGVTGSSGKFQVSHPNVPAILGSAPKGIFANVLDNGVNSAVEVITFSGITQFQLRSLSTGGAVSTSGVTINAHLRYDT